MNRKPFDEITISGGKIERLRVGAAAIDEK